MTDKIDITQKVSEILAEVEPQQPKLYLKRLIFAFGCFGISIFCLLVSILPINSIDEFTKIVFLIFSVVMLIVAAWQADSALKNKKIQESKKIHSLNKTGSMDTKIRRVK